jgi:aminoglycoside 2'-N-acetyltransferase I
VTVRVGHTAALEPDVLATTRQMLDAAFEGDLAAEDWEHGLGGMHVLAWQGGGLVGHASVVQRRILHGGRAQRVGYVEAVGVRPDRQRTGIGGLLMDAAEAVIVGGYDFGALASSDAGLAFYRSRGWLPWQGRTAVLAPGGIRPTPDGDDCVHVFPVHGSLALDGELVCDWRDGDVW